MVLTNIQNPQLKTVWINGQFYYQQGRSSLFHPVDRILKQTQTQEATATLAKWRDRVGQQGADRKPFVGKTLHQLIQNYLQNSSIVHCSNLIAPYWQSIQTVLQNITDTYLVETAVPYKGQYPYAGKIDFCGEYKGTPCVIEWTTSEDPKGLAEKLYDKRLQLTAYCGAVNHYYGIKINYALVVVSLPSQEAEIFEFEREHLINYWQEWQERSKLFYQSIA